MTHSISTAHVLASAEQASLLEQYLRTRGFLFLSSFYLHPFLQQQQMKEPTTHIKPYQVH